MNDITANNNSTVDLISTKGLDEMQRTEAYKIAFNCFKAFYWSVTSFAAALVIAAFFIENSILSYIGIALIVLSSAIYVAFALKSAISGAMNPDFAKKASHPGKIISMFIIGFGYTIVAIYRYLDGNHITHLYSGIFMAILYLSHIITYFLARKSIKAMNTETEE